MSESFPEGTFSGKLLTVNEQNKLKAHSKRPVASFSLPACGEVEWGGTQVTTEHNHPKDPGVDGVLVRRSSTQ